MFIMYLQFDRPWRHRNKENESCPAVGHLALGVVSMRTVKNFQKNDDTKTKI